MHGVMPVSRACIALRFWLSFPFIFSHRKQAPEIKKKVQARVRVCTCAAQPNVACFEYEMKDLRFVCRRALQEKPAT